MAINWGGTSELRPKGYICGYCGHRVGPSKAYAGTQQFQVQRPGMPASLVNVEHNVFICSYCNKPTYFTDRDDNTQTPGAIVGEDVAGVPAESQALYNEARRCVSVNAFTACTLSCRKLLMHIAVEQGAPEGDSFISYINFLADNHFIPPNGRAWVDYIRVRGNEANHTIEIMTRDDAINLLAFSEMLLTFIYEFPGRIPPAPPAPTTP